MGWLPRCGKRQPSLTASAPNPRMRIKDILGGLIFATLFFACIAFFPLTVILVPKPQMTEYMPTGVFCATCKQAWEHNRDLFNRADMRCYGPPTFDRPTEKHEEVMYGAMKRCWVLEEGHDEWLLPLQVTDEETEKWESGAKKVVIRGGRWM
ncbi:hypothetical protein EKO04_004074 [Ascochyta lentis]|uniref:Uncharacterized protein n=1 Tax=Ascochyta lentis TaxID=205686 RepID=A0A8H7J6Z9_9PLEO|nr:hypothetical protein EKO04_004074 [Ascochyta lentis]